MRISFFNYHYDLAGTARGAEVQIHAIASGLERLGHQVDLQFRATSTQEGEQNFGGLKQIGWLRRYGHVPRLLLRNLSLFRQECRLLDRFHPDVVLAISSYCNFSALLAARSRRLPFVLFAETPLEYEYGQFYTRYYRYPGIGRWIEGINVRRANQVTCISEVLKGYLTHCADPATRLHVIPNGVDYHAFQPQGADEELRGNFRLHDRLVVGFVGTFNFFAPVDTFAEVMKAVCQRYPRVVFFFVGHGEASEQIRQAGEQRGLHNQLIFTGAAPHAQVPRYLSVMDVVLCPYRGDYLFYGSSMKLLEYLAAGKATLATALGQIKEIITDGYNGMLFEADDHAGMQQKLLTLIEDENLRRQLGSNARRTIEQDWTWDIQVTRLDKVLRLARENSR
jgi:glycosyltransferase involved in cell wall biosynthesis